ncbi:MAG: hypothetical protein JJT76_15950 [Clostridiaceae bacterium]|nr:hypothetical protein [Clostridiaceae bacterium]
MTPSVEVGIPKELADFQVYQIEGVTVYLHKNIAYNKGWLTMYVEDYLNR